MQPVGLRSHLPDCVQGQTFPHHGVHRRATAAPRPVLCSRQAQGFVSFKAQGPCTLTSTLKFEIQPLSNGFAASVLSPQSYTRRNSTQADASAATLSAGLGPGLGLNSNPAPSYQHGYGYGKSAVVVGAGPAGVLAAIELVRRGFEVQVFERGQEQFSSVTENRRGYIIAVMERGLRAIRQAGAQPAFMRPDATAYVGSFFNGAPYAAMASASNTSSSSSSSSAQAQQHSTYLVHRPAIARDLVSEARRLHGERITFHYGQELAALDTHARTATFTPTQNTSSTTTQAAEQQPQPQQPDQASTPEALTLQYDLLVAADGANSTTRQALSEQVQGFTTRVLFEQGRTYKGISGLPDPYGHDGSMWEVVPGARQHPPGKHLYWFSDSNKVPAARAVALWKEHDGTYSGVLTNPPSYEEGPLRQYLTSGYLHLHPSWIEPIVQQTCSTGPMPKPGRVPQVLQHSQLHGPRCVVVGDAAHNVTPLLGQGCNSALETVSVFARVLDEAGGDLDVAPERYTAARLKDAHALQRLDAMMAPHLPGVGVALEKLAAKVLLVFSVVLPAIAHKALPGIFRTSPTSLLFGMQQPDKTFGQILGQLQAQGAKVAVVVALTLVATVMGLLVAWSAATQLLQAA